MSWVYFIRPAVEIPDPLTKIGFTSGEVSARLYALECGSPVPLEVAISFKGPIALERALHDAFSAHRVRREWFRLPKDWGSMAAMIAAEFGADWRAAMNRHAHLAQCRSDPRLSLLANHLKISKRVLMGLVERGELVSLKPEHVQKWIDSCATRRAA